MSDQNDDAGARYQLNQRVANVLTRHGIELDTLSISCSARLVYLYGSLKKDTGGKMTPTDISNIFREIEQIPHVRGIVVDLDNWTVTNTDGGWLVTPKGGRQYRGTTATTGEDYRIDKEEKIDEVLDEIRKKDDPR
ncbi:MAG: hypothetical protein LLG97_18610 [Deltaproteobacteria bacterium]|nr:hypothetical protein [Deltaproteobacteria bacterium]